MLKLLYTFEPLSLNITSTSKILPNTCKHEMKSPLATMNLT